MKSVQSVTQRRMMSWITLVIFLLFSVMPSPGYAAVVQTVGEDGRLIYTTDSDTVWEVGNFDQAAGTVWDFNLSQGNLLVNVNGGSATTWGGTTNIFGGLLGLFNPHGIHFTDSSRINLTNASFIGAAMNAVNGMNFDTLNLQGGGYLLNEGVMSGGDVTLLGRAVENRGTIEAPLNRITLAAGEVMTVGLSGDNLVSVLVPVDGTVQDFEGNDIEDQIKNSGTMTGNKITLNAKGVDQVFEKAINLKGEIKAVDIDINHKGELVVMSMDDVYNEAILEASKMMIETEGAFTNAGTMDASEGRIEIDAGGDVETWGVLKAENVIERGASFKMGGRIEVGLMDMDNLDNRADIQVGAQLSGNFLDQDDILVLGSFSLIGDTAIQTDSDGIGNDGTLTWASIYGVTGNGHDLTLKVSKDSTIGSVTGVGKLSLEANTGKSVTYTSNPLTTTWNNIADFRILTGAKLNRFTVENDGGNWQYSDWFFYNPEYDDIHFITDQERQDWYGIAPEDWNSSEWTLETIEQIEADGYQRDGGVWWRGERTRKDAYLVYDIYGLQALEGFKSPDLAIKLANDIDASSTVGWNSGQGFRPVGDDGTVGRFRADFNGNNKTISNLYINRPTQDYVGLFGGTDQQNANSTRDLNLTNVNITGRSIVGGLVGHGAYDGGWISNVSVTGSVSGTITDIERDTDPYARDGNGNIIYDWGQPRTNEEFWNTTSGGDHIGGLAGLLYHLSVDSSYTNVNVFGRAYVGGFVGDTDGYGSTITNSFSAGTVTGTGKWMDDRHNSSPNDSTYEWEDAPGPETTTIFRSYVGGFVGLNNYYYKFIDNFSTTTVNGTHEGSVGGFAGSFFSHHWGDTGAPHGAYYTDTSHNNGLGTQTTIDELMNLDHAVFRSEVTGLYNARMRNNWADYNETQGRVIERPDMSAIDHVDPAERMNGIQTAFGFGNGGFRGRSQELAAIFARIFGSSFKTSSVDLGAGIHNFEVKPEEVAADAHKVEELRNVIFNAEVEGLETRPALGVGVKTETSLLNITGNVKVVTQEGKIYNATEGMNLQKGDQVWTGDGAKVELATQGGKNIVKVEEKSAVSLDKEPAANNNSAVPEKDLLAIAFGKVSVAVSDDSGSRFAVQTPTVISGLRG